MVDQYKELVEEYEYSYGKSDTAVISLGVFIKCLWTFWKWCVVPFIPTQIGVCDSVTCGSDRKAVVFDGTCIGLLLKNLSEYHR